MPGWDLIAEQLPRDVAVRIGRASQTRAAMLGLREAPMDDLQLRRKRPGRRVHRIVASGRVGW